MACNIGDGQTQADDGGCAHVYTTAVVVPPPAPPRLCQPMPCATLDSKKASSRLAHLK